MKDNLVKWYKENRNLAEVYFWMALIIPTLIWWKDSILWVAMMSLYANIKTAHSAHEARKARRAAENGGQDAD